MEPNDDFKGIRKKMPFVAPDNFFEQAAFKTLQEAKRRERESRKTIYLWRSVGVAASIAAIGLAGYFMLNTDNKTETQLVAQKSKQADITTPENVVAQPSVNSLPVKESVKQEEITRPAGLTEESSENLEDLLADLTDEELLQMGAMIKSDPFEGGQEP